MGGAVPVTHLYDGCAECQERARKALDAPPARRPRPAPTASQLERHAKRFGPEGVAETAQELGVDVSVERPATRRSTRRPGLKARVSALVAQGHGVDVVAEVENLSPARARRIVEEVRRDGVSE